MAYSLLHIFILGVALIINLDAKIIKLSNIPSGESVLKPRSLHLRNSIQGNVEIADDVLWSLEVKIKGFNEFYEQDVALYCGVNEKDSILDIQVFQKNPPSSTQAPSKTLVTADIILRGPGYLIMPGSKIFFKTKSTGRVFLKHWSGYKGAIEVYEVPPVYRMLDISHPCYDVCENACDVLDHFCLPCKRGFEFDAGKSEGNDVECKDINECNIGSHTCPTNTQCENTIGGYSCKCREGFFGDGLNCQACKPCPSGWYELLPCNATHDVVCKKCSPPCERYAYEVHTCGVGYDRKCEDILTGLQPIDASSMLKPAKSFPGSELAPFAGLEKYIITDDRMRSTAAETSLEFATNVDKEATIWRSSYLQIDLKLSHVNVLPTFADSAPLIPEQDRFFAGFSGLVEIKGSYCRHPIGDSYALKHEFYNDYKTTVTKSYCVTKQKDLCPDEAGFGQVYAKRTAIPCGNENKIKLDHTKLVCSSYVNIASAFGITKYMFDDALVWKFQEKSCFYLYTACNQCRKDKCTGEKPSLSCEKQCDFICQCYHKKHCAKTMLPCATGDLSEWTLKQRFEGRDLSERFNCYLKRVIADKLFSISYRVKVPNTELKSDWIRVSEKQVQKRKDVFQIGNFEIKYERGETLTDNVVLTGHRYGQKSAAKYFFDLRNIKGLVQADFLQARGGVNFVPAQPFSHTRHQWSDESNCRVLSFWEKYLAKTESPILDMAVNKAGKSGQRFLYRVQSHRESTKINISFSSSKPVLNYLGKVARIIKLNSTAKANISHWILHLKANITACPAYFEITVIEKTASALVLKQDILVLCPSKNHFHVVAVVPKKMLLPAYKARLFMVYISNGKNIYETHIEKLDELKVEGRFDFKRATEKKSVSKKNFDVRMLSKFDSIILLTGVFIIGIVTLLVLACLIRPSKEQKARQKGRQHAAVQLGQKDDVRGQLDNEDKLQWRHLIPIVFLVAFRVAYSFVLTVSFVVIVFTIVNKSDLEDVKDFKEFVQLKINQSNQISLALDLFRESETKIMTDKAAFMECACDYHMGRIMRNMRDNMTAIIQLHDLIAFDKISEALIRVVLKRVTVLSAIHGKINRYKGRIASTLYHIESRLNGYAYRVYNNKYFTMARGLWGAWQDFRSLDFLSSIGSFDSTRYYQIKREIARQLGKLKNMFRFDSIVKRLLKPLYPLANALLTPLRNMKRKVKEAVIHRINSIKDKILRNIPCIGNIDMKKWERYDDDFDEEARKRCRIQAANKFMEKIIDDIKSAKNSSSQFVVSSVRDDASFNILDGDAYEEAHENRQDKRLATLKKLADYYKGSEEAKVALRLLKSHSVILVLVFDVLLITYRSLKTYRFAFMMVSGYEKKVEYKRIGEKLRGDEIKKERSAGRKMVDCLAKFISLFFSTFTLMLKLIFTTIIIPVLVIIIGILVSFYLTIAFAYNGMNVDALEKLGAFKFLSSRLDLNFNVTREALKEHALYLNKFDVGMYKESIRVQTEEFRNTIKEFNADEIIRVQRLHAELCDTEDRQACNIDFKRLMEKLEMNVKPCVFPVIKARMPDNIYDSDAYRKQLKHELKHYVDSARKICINTLYIIAGIVGTILLTVIGSKLIFKFLMKLGMIRVKERHIYHELPLTLRKRYEDGL